MDNKLELAYKTVLTTYLVTMPSARREATMRGDVKAILKLDLKALGVLVVFLGCAFALILY